MGDVLMEPPDRDVDDPSGLVAKLRALFRRNGNGGGGRAAGLRTRVFETKVFYRLWLAQAITSMGDWLAFLAILVTANRVGSGVGVPGASIGLVMAARIVPGLFFGSAAGVLVDRMDRKQVMVVTTVMRAGVVALLPWVDNVLGLMFASLVLELATLLFSPAKEATVPNLVSGDRLASANSLSLAAAYGTFPVAALVFALLSKVASWLGTVSAFDMLRTTQEAVAFYVAAACYLGTAWMITRLAIPRDHVRLHEDEDIDLGQAFKDLRDGWHYAFINPVVRGVNIALATGLIGGGMLVPLGDKFSREILGAGAGGFGLFIAALGCGVGAGIIGVSARQRVISKRRAFFTSVFGAGFALLVGVSMSNLGLAVVAVAVMGVFAGRVYVLGFTLLHENVDDELRGRVFAGLYILVRLCVLLSMAIGPMLQDPLDGLSNRLVGRDINVVGIEIAVPGVRLTLWLAAVIMLLAGVLARRSMQSASQPSPGDDGASPDDPDASSES